MNERLRWWVLPAAMIVLLRVVTLEGSEPRERLRAPDAAPAAGDDAAAVVVLEASGKRTLVPAALTATEAAFCVDVPAGHAGRRGSMTLWRRSAAGREAEPWLVFTPRVPVDATVRIAGLAAGCYDVEWRLGDEVLAAEAALAPGSIAVAPPAAPQR